MKKLVNLKSLTVLYVEDDDVIRIEFTEILNRLFGNVISARHGDEALFLYNQFMDDDSIDFIISDVDMPIMNGLELLKEIRIKNNKIPFIFTTAHSEVDFLLKAISLNVSEYLIKPINVNALKSKIEILFAGIFKEKNKNKKLNELSEYVNVVDKVAIVSKTDKDGIITYANDFFCEASGYSREELIGSNHNIVRHPNNSKLFYENMWKELKRGDIWKGKIKNLSKNNESYFLTSTIIPIYDKDENEIIEYVGIKFLSTQVEMKNREFKKKVICNVQENKKIHFTSNKRIAELESELKSLQHSDFVRESLKVTKMKNNKLLSHISSLENELQELNTKVNKIASDANVKVSKATHLLRQEKEKSIKLFGKVNEMEEVIEDKNESLIKLKYDVGTKNKRIIDLSDVIEHREEQLYRLGEDLNID